MARRTSTAGHFPARQFTVSGSLAAAVDTATAALVRQGYRVNGSASAPPVVLEYGSLFGELLFGTLNLSILPGTIGKHAFAVVDAVDNGDDTGVMTMAFVTGANASGTVVTAAADTLAALAAAEVLLDAGSPMSAFDLPESSVAHPAGFRRFRASAGR